MIKYFYLVFMVPLFFWIFIKLLYRNRTGAYVCDRILLMIPVMGAIVEKSTVARTMRTLGTLVQSGVPILESLNIVRTRRATPSSSGRSRGSTTASARARRSRSRCARRGSSTTSWST